MHVNYVKALGGLLLGLALTVPAFAQDTQANLEKAIKGYNDLRTFTGQLKATTITDADLDRINNSVNEGVALLDPIANGPASPLSEVAKYFRVNYRYERGFTTGMKGRRNDALTEYRAIESEMNSLTEGRFPLEYTLEERKFTIRYSNFSPTLAEFNTGLCELLYLQKDYDNALGFARKARNIGLTTNYLRTLNNYWIINIKNSQKEQDRELLDAALELLEAHSDLTADEQDALLKQDAQLVDKAVLAIEQTLTANPSLSNGGDAWARASRLLVKEKRDAKAVEMASKAITGGFREREFLLSTVPLANSAGDKTTARMAADTYANGLTANDCAGLGVAADNYTKIGDNTTANRYRKRADDCTNKLHRTERRRNRDNGLYVGTYVFPWFRSDWGGVGGIQTNRHLIEFSYQDLSNRRDKLYDLRVRGIDGASEENVRWDGYYTHLAINKLSGKKGRRTYNGLLLGYNLREFRDLTVPVITNENGAVANPNGPVVFNPKEQRYIVMFNSGLHSYGKFLFSDIFLSFGGAWSTFERGNNNFDNDGFDYSNPLLDHRKSGRFSLMARIGVTVGLQVGSRTLGR